MYITYVKQLYLLNILNLSVGGKDIYNIEALKKWFRMLLCMVSGLHLNRMVQKCEDTACDFQPIVTFLQKFHSVFIFILLIL